MTDRYAAYSRLAFDRPAPRVLRITMNRPEKLNAADDVMHRELAHVWRDVDTDPDVGDYHRMLLPGTYTLHYDAPGYRTETVTGIAVADGPATRVDVALVPLTGALADVDGDGDVDAVDVQLVINAVLGLPCPPGMTCDVDGGGPSATDVQFAINAALGLV